MPNNITVNSTTYGTHEVGGTHYPVQKMGYGSNGSINVMDTKPATEDTSLNIIAELTELNTNITLGAKDESQSLAVADSSLTIFTSASGAPNQNTDLLTNSVNGWYDVGDFTTATVQIITSAGISGGGVIFEHTNDSALYPAGLATFGYEITGAQSTPLSGLTLAASTSRILKFPLHCKYFRIRTTSSVTGGTVQVSLGLSQRVLAHTTSQVYQTNATNFNVTANGTSGHNGTAAGNPVTIGAIAKNAPTTGITNGNGSRLACTPTGLLLTQPYADAAQDWHGSAVLTTTADTALKAAAGGSVRNYCTNIDYINTSAVATTLLIKDGTTVIWTGYAPANMTTPASVVFSRPRRTAANTVLNIAAGTAGANIYVNASGFIDV